VLARIEDEAVLARGAFARSLAQPDPFMKQVAARSAVLALASIGALVAVRAVACAPKPVAVALSEQRAPAAPPPSRDAARLAIAAGESERTQPEALTARELEDQPVALDVPPPVAPAAVHARVRATLHGRVYDRRGQLVAGVAIADEQHPQVELARSAADGRFEVRAPSRELLHLVTTSESPWHALRKPIALDSTRPEDQHELMLVVAPAVLVAGSVQLPDGMPAANASLRLARDAHALPEFPLPLDRTSRVELELEVDELGRFGQARVPSGTSLEVEHAPCCERMLWPVPAQDELAASIRLEARAASRQFVIEGSVVHEDERPAPGAQVHYAGATIATDELGRFRWSSAVQPAPSLALVATKPGSQPGTVSACTELLLERGGELLELRVALGPPTLSIAGRVLTADDRPCAYWRVQLAQGTALNEDAFPLTLAEHLSVSDAQQTHVTTDPEGRFRLRGLSAREYELLAFDPNTLLSLRAESVPAGKRDLILRLAPGALREKVKGRLLDLRGAPIAQARVCVTLTTRRSRAGWMWESSAFTDTDAQGDFVLAQLPRTGCELYVSGEPVIPQHFAVPEDFEEIELRATRRCHFQLELHAQRALPGELAFQLLDAQGAVQPIVSFQSLGSSATDRQAMPTRSSGVLAAPQNACTLVLSAGGVELERMPIELLAGQVTRITW